MKTFKMQAGESVLMQLAQAYGDEAKARALLESWRWPRGAVCPHCQNAEETNTAESFFSLLKRGVIGAWHHVSREHLSKYANEFAFRWNTRHDSDGLRLAKFVGCIEGKRLIYRHLSQTLCVC